MSEGSDKEEVEVVENEYVVEKILDKRGSGKKTEYFIKWRGYDDPAENTWEPVANCDCPELIAEFEAAHKKKEKPKRDEKSRSRTIRASTKSAEPEDSKRDRKRKATVAASSQPRQKRTPPKSRVVLSSDSSDSEVEQLTPMANKKEEDDTRPQDSSTPQPTKQEPETSRYAPVDDLPLLDFIVSKIVGIIDDNDYKKVVVRTQEGKLEIAEIKAVARQNIDLIIDYLLPRLEQKK
jgi:hypothetical protein